MFKSLALAGLLTVSLTLTACGSDDGGTTSTTSPSGAADAAFPVTIEHRLGTTTIEKKPERVVVVGLTEQDILLELGVVPVAVTEWYGDKPYATWPWAQDLLGDAKPVVLSQSDGLQFEKIGTLAPDLIVGTNSGISKEDYEKLSAIAPTITNAPGGTEYFSTWQDQTRIIAEAVGLKEKGEELVAGVEKAYADAAKAHPEFAGKTATFSQGQPYDGIFYVYQDGLGTDFLTELGFTITPGLEKYSKGAGQQAEISTENTNLLDADVIVWATEDQKMFDELQKVPTISGLKAVSGNRSVYTDGDLAGALYFLTPLSQKYALTKLLPQLEKAVAGENPRELSQG